MLQFSVNGSQELMLRPVLGDFTVKDQLAFVTGVEGLDERHVREHLLHRQAGDRMMRVD
ncbi:hypothetical protein D3C73_1540710 [compost metagenome]